LEVYEDILLRKPQKFHFVYRLIVKFRLCFI